MLFEPVFRIPFFDLFYIHDKNISSLQEMMSHTGSIIINACLCVVHLTVVHACSSESDTSRWSVHQKIKFMKALNHSSGVGGLTCSLTD